MACFKINGEWAGLAMYISYYKQNSFIYILKKNFVLIFKAMKIEFIVSSTPTVNSMVLLQLKCTPSLTRNSVIFQGLFHSALSSWSKKKFNCNYSYHSIALKKKVPSFLSSYSYYVLLDSWESKRKFKCLHLPHDVVSFCTIRRLIMFFVINKWLTCIITFPFFFCLYIFLMQ